MAKCGIPSELPLVGSDYCDKVVLEQLAMPQYPPVVVIDLEEDGQRHLM